MNRAAIYSRVSDKSQDGEDKTSISEQISDMEAYCERRGQTIAARYQEVGRGWSKSRPEFQRMLADARMGRFDTIVCWKSDRLSRGMYPAAALMEVVEAYQIEIEAVMDTIDMKTFGLMAAIGKIELDNFRERASMGKRGSAKQGRIPVSNIPYGYRIGEDRRPQVVEAEAEIVRRVFRLYVREGMGAPAIAKQLTAEGVPTPRAAVRWHHRTVTRILTLDAYRGTWWFGKIRHVATEAGMRKYDRPEDEWIGVPFPRLVDEETWELAQEAKKQRLTRSSRNTKVFYLLQHLVRCAECGYLMGCRAARRQTAKRDGKAYGYEVDTLHRYYNCYGMLNEGVRCREHPYIRAERLEERVWSEVKRVLENPGLIVAGIEALATQAEGGGSAEEVARAERELQRVQMEEDRAIRLYVSGKITEKQLDHQRRFITERLETLRKALDDYRARESAQAEKRMLGEHIVEWARRAGDRLDGLPDEGRREVLQLLLDGATIDRNNNVNLTLAVPTEDVVSIAGLEPSSPPTSAPLPTPSAATEPGPAPRWRSSCERSRTAPAPLPPSNAKPPCKAYLGVPSSAPALCVTSGPPASAYPAARMAQASGTGRCSRRPPCNRMQHLMDPQTFENVGTLALLVAGSRPRPCKHPQPRVPRVPNGVAIALVRSVLRVPSEARVGILNRALSHSGPLAETHQNVDPLSRWGYLLQVSVRRRAQPETHEGR